MLEHAHAGADRAGADEDDVAAKLALRRDLRDELIHLREVGLLLRVGEDAGAELNYDPGSAPRRIFQKISAHCG